MSGENAGANLRRIALESDRKHPKEVREIYEQLVMFIQKNASEGRLGCLMTISLPEHLEEYLPHIIGDLRGGGMCVDIASYQRGRTAQQTVLVGLVVTW